MRTSFKARFWQLARWGAILFLVLFIFRLIYGYVSSNTSTSGDYSGDYFDNISQLRRNYATEKVYATKSSPSPQQAPDFSTNQKYEKTASVKSKSSDFTKDEQLLRTEVASFKAMIQYEKALGQKGNRELHLMIGVNPDAFDSFYVAIQQIGTIKSMSITKVDKTNDYRQLNAKKVSLEKTLQSMEELKNKPGTNTQDLLEVYDRILTIEGNLQDLGVELGNFNTENEFCTVKLSLYEGVPAKSISLIYRMKIALQWTIHYFAFTMFGAAMVLLGAFTLLLVIDKLKILGMINSKLEE